MTKNGYLLFIFLIFIRITFSIKCWTGQKELGEDGQWDSYIKDLDCESTSYCANVTTFTSKYNKTVCKLNCGDELLFNECNVRTSHFTG